MILHIELSSAKLDKSKFLSFERLHAFAVINDVYIAINTLNKPSTKL